MRISDWSSDVCSSDLASAFMATSQGAWAMRSRRHPAPLDPLLPRDTRNHVCHSPGTSTTRDALTSLAPSAGAAGSFDNVAAPLAPPLNGPCPALIVKLPGQVKDRKSTRLNSSH